MTAWIRVRLMKAKGWTGSTRLMLSIALKEVYKLMKNEVVCADCNDCINKNNCKYQSAILADELCEMKQSTSLYVDGEYIKENELNELKSICDDTDILKRGKIARMLILTHLNAIYNANKTLDFEQRYHYIAFSGDSLTERFGLNFTLKLSKDVRDKLHNTYDNSDDVRVSEHRVLSRYRYERYSLLATQYVHELDERKQSVISILNGFSAETYIHMINLYSHCVDVVCDTIGLNNTDRDTLHKYLNIC